VDFCREAFGAGSEREIWSRFHLARALFELGEFAQAASVVDQALSEARAAYAPDDARTVRLTALKSLVHATLRPEDEPSIDLEELRRALHPVTTGLDARSIAWGATVSAEALLSDGDAMAAVVLLAEAREVLATWDRFKGAKLDLAFLDVSLASAERRLGRFEDAEARLSDALPRLRESCGSENWRPALAERELALLYAATGRAHVADGLLVHALPILGSVLGAEHPLAQPRDVAAKTR
jgi:tetratricopeptide (TPR) repeat protein